MLKSYYQELIHRFLKITYKNHFKENILKGLYECIKNNPHVIELRI